MTGTQNNNTSLHSEKGDGQKGTQPDISHDAVRDIAAGPKIMWNELMKFTPAAKTSSKHSSTWKNKKMVMVMDNGFKKKCVFASVFWLIDFFLEGRG